jgi:5'-nucleotidase
MLLQDEKLKELMQMYHKAGRKVFLATNSLWAYTNVVMNFLIDGVEGRERTTDWLKV